MDWIKIIGEIQAKYAERTGYKNFGYERIAILCNVSKTHIYKLAKGKSKNPSFDIGQKLLALHRGEIEPTKFKHNHKEK